MLADEFWEWLAHGVKEGWVAEGGCQTHGAVPMTEDEKSMMEEGGDPCIPVLRVWAV